MSIQMDDEWPAGHSIGVYLAVGEHSRLVGTARDRGNLASLFRHLADAWERMVEKPELIDAGEGWAFPEAGTTSGCHVARGA